MLLICFLAQAATSLVISNLTATISNALSNSTFTIDFQSSVQVRSQCTVLVSFPSVYNLTQVPTFNSSLTLINNSIEFKMEKLLKSVTYTLVIDGVFITDTLGSGSSGLFKIYTFKGTTLLEQNQTAGCMGVSPPFTSLVNPIVYLDPDSLPFAGQIAYYNFVFSLHSLPPYSTRIQIKMPQQFSLPTTPSCSLFSTDASFKDITMPCYSSIDNVILNNFTVFNKRIALKVSLLNPNRTGTTDTFSISVYKEHTSSVISMSTSLPGVTIQHGRLYSLSLQPHNPYALLSKNKIQDYLLGFTPRNSLPARNKIQIQMPPYVLLIKNTIYDYVRVIAGLNGSLTWDQTTITIENATVFSRVQIVLRLMNPPLSGQTNPFTISTYGDDVLIDHSQQLTLVIQDIESTAVSIYPSFNMAIQPINNMTNATIVVSNLELNNPVCRLNSIKTNCRTLNGQIILQPFNLSRTPYNLTIQNIDYYPGIYLVDIYVYDAARKQSDTAIININSHNFIHSSISAIDCEVSQPPNYNRSSILNITVVTDYDATYRFKMVFSPMLTGRLTVKPILGIIPVTELSTTWVDNTLYIGNFMPITNNTRVEIHIAGVDNPETASNISVSIANQLETTLRLVTLNYYQQNVVYGVMPTRQYGYTAVLFNVTSYAVGKQFTLSFQPMVNGDLANVHLLVQLPGYYTMFLAGNNKVSCQIDSVFYECVAYSQTDWILILDVPSLKNINMPIITLFGLQWPIYSDTVGYVSWRAIDAVTLIEKDRKTLGNIVGNTTFPAPTTAQLSNVSVAVSDTSLKAPGVTFSFRFTTSCLLPSNSTLVIHFPTEYTLNVSTVRSILPEPAINASQITFAGLQEIPAMTVIQVYVTGVKMPNAALPDGGFSIYATLYGKPIQDAVNFGSIQYSSAFQPDLIDITLSVALPLVSIRTQLLLSLQPYHSIPASGTIVIDFPFDLDFSGCRLVGAITQFSQCDYSGRRMRMTLAEAYYTGVMNITLSQWLAPAVAGEYTISVETYYDDSMLDSSTVNMTIYSVQTTITGSVSSQPPNEGEYALFTATITTTKASDTITLIPSVEFSRQPIVQQVSHIGQHTIQFYSINPSGGSITVVSSSSGALQEQGDILYSATAAADWLQLLQYSINDSYVGRPSLLTLQLLIPYASNASILEISLDHFDCSRATVSGNYSVTTYESRVLIAVNSSGTLLLSISLLNPNRSGEYTMTMRVLENGIVISKVFDNLDQVIINIVDIGPIFRVNNNLPIIVYQNTISDTVYIDVDYPSRYMFTIVPVSITPIDTIIFPLYGRRVGFTLKASCHPGSYKIKWNIQHQHFNQFYNPIVQTVVEIRPCSIMNIQVQRINTIPAGGNTLPLKIQIPFVPLTPIQLTLSVNGSFKLSASQLVFQQPVQYFTIHSSEQALFQGSILQISSNHSNYTMSSWLYDVVSLPSDDTVPFISQLNVIEAARSYVIVSIGTSQLAVVQLVVLPWYASQPSIVGGILNKDDAVFATVVNLTLSVQEQVRILNLSSDGHYVVYCLATDRSNIVSSLRSQEIVTLEHRKAIEILYPFRQPNITVYERDQILVPLLAFYLSCPAEYLLSPYSHSFLTSDMANVYKNQVFYQAIWIILPDDYQISQVLEQLQGSKSYVSKTLTYISVDTPVTATQVNWTVPSITSLNISVVGQQIEAHATLSDYGTVYIAVSKRILNYTYQMRELANCTGINYNSLEYSCRVDCDSLTDYIVYATAGDIGPTFTTLGSTYTAQKITTQPQDVTYHLNVNSGSRSGIWVVVCLLHLLTI